MFAYLFKSLQILLYSMSESWTTVVPIAFVLADLWIYKYCILSDLGLAQKKFDY